MAVVRMLLDARADVNAARWNGDTPLLAAVNAGSLEIMRLLVDHGARSTWRKTAWDKRP
jgi:ankyrin repeat protein